MPSNEGETSSGYAAEESQENFPTDNSESIEETPENMVEDEPETAPEPQGEDPQQGPAEDSGSWEWQGDTLRYSY